MQVLKLMLQLILGQLIQLFWYGKRQKLLEKLSKIRALVSTSLAVSLVPSQ